MQTLQLSLLLIISLWKPFSQHSHCSCYCSPNMSQCTDQQHSLFLFCFNRTTFVVPEGCMVINFFPVPMEIFLYLICGFISRWLNLILLTKVAQWKLGGWPTCLFKPSFHSSRVNYKVFIKQTTRCDIGGLWDSWLSIEGFGAWSDIIAHFLHVPLLVSVVLGLSSFQESGKHSIRNDRNLSLLRLVLFPLFALIVFMQPGPWSFAFVIWMVTNDNSIS